MAAASAADVLLVAGGLRGARLLLALRRGERFRRLARKETSVRVRAMARECARRYARSLVVVASGVGRTAPSPALGVDDAGILEDRIRHLLRPRGTSPARRRTGRAARIDGAALRSGLRSPPLPRLNRDSLSMNEDREPV